MIIYFQGSGSVLTQSFHLPDLVLKKLATYLFVFYFFFTTGDTWLFVSQPVSVVTCIKDHDPTLLPL